MSVVWVWLIASLMFLSSILVTLFSGVGFVLKLAERVAEWLTDPRVSWLHRHRSNRNGEASEHRTEQNGERYENLVVLSVGVNDQPVSATVPALAEVNRRAHRVYGAGIRPRA